MFPEPIELLLIGCSIESIWTPKSKSNTLTPKTNSQTYWPRAISHVTNGIIFCACSALAISGLQSVLKWCRTERKKESGEESHSKIETDDEFGLAMQRKGSRSACFHCNRSQCWILSREAMKGLHQRYLLLHQKARGKPRHESQSPLSPQAEKYVRTGTIGIPSKI